MVRLPAVVLSASLAFSLASSPGIRAHPRPGQQADVAQAYLEWSDQEIERFLKTARIARVRSAGKGITGSRRITLTDGQVTHDAHVQIIEQFVREFRPKRGNVEFNFKDSWSFNIAAYRLDRLLGLNMVPVSVERRWQTSPASFTWWVDDVMMDEEARYKKKIEPPSTADWNPQMQLLRVFDQLIYNTDRNLGNLLITRDWRLWAIDHTRAFRPHPTLRSPESVTRCDRAVLERMRGLSKELLRTEIGRYLTEGEIDGLLARRDLIVQRLETEGPGALFERAPR